MSSLAERSKDGQLEYFKLANPIWYIIIVPSLVYLFLLAYTPYIIPFENLGSFGTFSYTLSTKHKIVPILIFWGAAAAHIFEAIYVVKKARLLNINNNCLNKWFFQTLLVGMASTILMIRFYNKSLKKETSK